MSAELVALVAGTVLAVGALAFVLYPLFFGASDDALRADTATPRRAAEDSAIVALREIEFDRATGKLSDADYAELRHEYSARALRELRQADAGDAAALSAAPAPHDVQASPPVPSPPLDPVEARIRAVRATHPECDTCGVRPEPDAIYCSTCGSFLARECPTCAAEIAEPGAAFCARCGTSLGVRHGVLA